MHLVIFAYFCAYLAFSASTKLLGREVDATVLMCSSVIACAGVWASVLLFDFTARRRSSLIAQALPRLLERDVVITSSASVIVMVVSTLAYSTPGVSLLVPLLLMKGGVLLWGPVLDGLRGDAITSRSRNTLALAAIAVLCALWHKVSVSTSLGTGVAILCAAVYVAVYFPKLHVLSRHRGERDFLFAELTTTLLLALPLAAAYALLRSHGSAVATLLHRPQLWVLSAASEGCALFGGLLFVARIQSTLAVTLSRCTSLLGGFVATLLLWVAGGGRLGTWLLDAGNWPELAGVGVMIVALVLGSSGKAAPKAPPKAEDWPSLPATAAA